jgi:hypothetical protein
MPSEQALTNPYTGQVIAPVSQPSLGDFIWSTERFQDEQGNEYEKLIVGFFYDPAGDRQRLEKYEIYHDTSSLPPLEDEVRHRIVAWLEALSERERRLYWICESLRVELDWMAERFFGGTPPATFAAYAPLDSRIPETIMPNLWQPRVMSAVALDQPTAGDFSYGWWPDDIGNSAIVEIKCYGDNARLVYSDLEPILQESFALERSPGLPGDPRVFPVP